MDAKLVMQGWEFKLAGRFTIDQILFALDQYTDKNSDFPAPADLICILEPEKPKITESQFIEAQNWQKRNKDWSSYSQAALTISDYRKQCEEKKVNYETSCERIKQIASGCVKRITTENKTHKLSKHDQEKGEEPKKDRGEIIKFLCEKTGNPESYYEKERNDYMLEMSAKAHGYNV